jgi:peroxiredoxin
MSELGNPAANFKLPEPATGKQVALADFDDKPALLVAFICNHCPFVKLIKDEFAAFAREYQAKGLAVVAISANDVAGHPADSPEKMAGDVREKGYTFPYLYDETQDVAKAFRAACTPEFYVFDRAGKLAYRGQFDDSRPSNGKPATGADVSAALDALLTGSAPSSDQKPSIGCNVKWKRGAVPDYA